MHGSLALSRGVLFVGVHAKTARVATFDLGGRALGTSFSFRDASAGRSSVSGLDVDEDRTLWIADTPAGVVRIFTLFGREVGTLGTAVDEDSAGRGLPGLVVQPVDVAVQGHRDEGQVAVASGGERRHAVQLFGADRKFRTSCASLGDPRREFRGVRRLAFAGNRLYVVEALARTVQVFREGEFLFAFQLRDRSGEAYEPSAVAPLEDGRIVVACRAPESALVLVDPSGRPLGHLAAAGVEEGRVDEPSDVVLEPGADDRHARLYAIDRDGLRVQVFTLEGRALGSIPIQPEAGRSRSGKGGR